MVVVFMAPVLTGAVVAGCAETDTDMQAARLATMKGIRALQRFFALTAEALGLRSGV